MAQDPPGQARWLGVGGAPAERARRRDRAEGALHGARQGERPAGGRAARGRLARPGAGGREPPLEAGGPAPRGLGLDGGAETRAGELAELKEWLRCVGAGEAPPPLLPGGALAAAAAASVAASVGAAQAAEIDPFFQFQPVCPYSDGVFRAGQKAALVVAGSDNIEDYRPLINDVLIRVRTELCVLESFARETAIPFVQQKGVGWVLPLHETSETYLAGVVFMVGTNFILLGSTKVVAILAIYHDLILGFPARQLGRLLGLANVDGEAQAAETIDILLEEQARAVREVMSDRELASAARSRETARISAKYAAKLEEVREGADAAALERQTSALGKINRALALVGVPLGFYGLASLKLKELLELFDTFCSRYFVALTVLYVIVKTAHYVFFPDIFSDGLPGAPELPALPALPPLPRGPA